MPETLRVWLIEDHKTYGERLSRALNRIAGISCDHRFTDCEDAFAALRISLAARDSAEQGRTITL